MVEPLPRRATLEAVRRSGIDVTEVLLLASRREIEARLGHRGDPLDGWAARQFDRCDARLRALACDPRVLVHDTDGFDHDAVRRELTSRLILTGPGKKRPGIAKGRCPARG